MSSSSTPDICKSNKCILRLIAYQITVPYSVPIVFFSALLYFSLLHCSLLLPNFILFFTATKLYIVLCGFIDQTLRLFTTKKNSLYILISTCISQTLTLELSRGRMDARATGWDKQCFFQPERAGTAFRHLFSRSIALCNSAFFQPERAGATFRFLFV